ncbi:MAG: NAD-dependent epimerase/dehydratase family protein [Deltaproteobacteria bacterium]|nr:NAD-dependent epimerase/dehydratase family protein [Deltaproteobacteria bacterium]
MKILVTGGAGFIGSQIVDRYLAAGHEVVIVDNFESGRRENVPAKVRCYAISINDNELAEVIKKEKPDLVNHHAAQIDVRKSVEDPATDATINIVGSLNLLECCRRSGVKKVIFASSGGAIYGEQDYYPADEKHRMEPRSPYGITKLTVEKYLQSYHWTHGLSFVALRYANVYGPRQNALGEAGVIAIFTNKLLKGESPIINGDGEQTRDYVFVDDVVACNLEALKPEVRGIINVGSGIETSVNQIAQELIRLTGAKVSPQRGPGKSGEQKRSCLKPGVLQKGTPTVLATGLAKTVEWFKQR